MGNTIFIPDVHVPYQDDTAWRKAVDVVRQEKPTNIVILGDFVDFYQLSRFDKAPSRMDKLQSELDLATDLLAELRGIRPKAHILCLEGNHEERLTKWMWEHPEVSSLKCLAVPKLLKFEELGIEFAAKPVMLDGILIEHGDYLSKHAGMSARRQLEERGVNGISGHSHRLGIYYKRDFSGTKFWAEGGCLCRLDPEYQLSPNWQHGLSILKKGELRQILLS